MAFLVIGGTLAVSFLVMGAAAIGYAVGVRETEAAAIKAKVARYKVDENRNVTFEWVSK